MIDIKQLIQIAPFPEETKSQLLEKVDSFTADKKFEIEQMCWAFIAQDLENKLQHEAYKALSSPSGDKQRFNIQEAENRLLTELTQRLTESATEEKIEEVREKLEAVKNTETPSSSS